MGLTQKLGTIPLAIFTDASNNIGIGGSPSGSYKFQLTGTSYFSGASTFASSINSGQIQATASGAVIQLIGQVGSNAYYVNDQVNNSGKRWRFGHTGAVSGYNSFDFYNQTDDRLVMTLASTGNVGIGTSSPSHKLHVEQDTTGYATINIRNPNTTVNSGASLRLYSSGYDNMPAEIINKPDSTGGTLLFNIRRADGTYNDFVTFRGDGNIRFNSTMYSNTTGGTIRTVYIGNSDYFLGGISSIRKSKKNIQEFTSEWIYDLKPVKFNYRKKDEEGKYTEETYEDLNYGLIAEDTAPIADFLINYNDKEDGTKEMIGIEYPRLITPLLKAIQDQKKLIDELLAKVSALENKS
jgi:hypothetical protein